MLRRLLGYGSAARRIDRRRDHRYDGNGVTLVHKGERHPVLDISLSGLRVRAEAGRSHHDAHPAFHRGQRVAFTLELPMPVRTLTVAGHGEVIRVAGGEAALRYVGLDRNLMRMLFFFLDPHRIARTGAGRETPSCSSP